MKQEEKTVKNKAENGKKKFRLIPESTGMGIAMLVLGFAEVLFLMFVLALDVLPFKYLLAGIILLFGIDALVVYLANSKSKHGTRRISALLVIVCMMIVLLTGDYYIYSTTDTLNKISEKRDTWEYYDVMASKTSSYENVDDITGETVYVTAMDSKQLKEARERLVTKADVEYKEETNVLSVGKHICSGETKESADAADPAEAAEKIGSEVGAESSEEITASDDSLILIADSQREILNDNIKGFNKSTKIIYRMKVRKRADDNSKAVDVTKDSFNVLISGLDSWGTIDEGGLSDVNMVMTVNPTTREVMLTSIPRDSYVTLHSYGQKDKLTHSGIYGEEETKKTIEDFLGIEINYTVRVNFSMFCDIIDAIGGVKVYNDTDFYSSVKGWHYAKGWHDMGGHYALWFARERKSFMDGDMKRNANQQLVLEAMIKKVTQSKVILTRYPSILDAIEDEMATDMTSSDLKKLARMQLNDMKKWTITRVNITGTTGPAPCYSMGNRELSCVFPDEETVEEAKTKIHDVMYPVDNTKTKKEQEKQKKKKQEDGEKQ